METCGAFLGRGCNVTILEMMPHIVPALMDEAMARLIEKNLAERGVHIVTGSPVNKILGDDSGKVDCPGCKEDTLFRVVRFDPARGADCGLCGS